MISAAGGVAGCVIRVLGVCGSLQRRSANRAALDVVYEATSSWDANVDDFDDLARIPPFDADRVDEPIDVLADWRLRVDAADVIVIAAPEYAGALAGVIKNALDWLVGSGNLYRKPVVIVSAGTSGGGYARQQLAQTLTWQGAYVVAELGIGLPRTKSDADGRITDETTIAGLVSVADVALEATSMSGSDLVDHARRVVEPLGIDVAHLAPAAA